MSRKNLRVCQILYSSTYYDIIIAVDNLDQVDNALLAWASTVLGVSSLDLPTALIYNKDISDVSSLSALTLDSYVYLQGASTGSTEENEVFYFAETEIDLKTGLTSQGACTFSNASGSLLCTDGSHAMSDGDPIQFTTTGALPTGLVIDTVYYVRDATADTFKLATTKGGTAIVYSDIGSGTHTSWALNKITIALPDDKYFNITKFGIICTIQDGTVSGYPTVRYHVSDTAGDLESPASHTNLTAKGKGYRSTGPVNFFNVVDGAELMADITIAGAQSSGSIYKGRPFFAGVLLDR